MSRYRNPAVIDTIIIHCADTPNGKDFTVDDIDQWHLERGFWRSDAFINDDYPRRAIGYHFVIDIAGHIHFGRKIDEVGAHCKGHNSTSIGICLIGRDSFSAEQWLSLTQKIAALQNAYPGITHICGHNQFNPHKTCPGFDVKQWLEGGMKTLDGHVYE